MQRGEQRGFIVCAIDICKVLPGVEEYGCIYFLDGIMNKQTNLLKICIFFRGKLEQFSKIFTLRSPSLLSNLLDAQVWPLPKSIR